MLAKTSDVQTPYLYPTAVYTMKEKKVCPFLDPPERDPHLALNTYLLVHLPTHVAPSSAPSYTPIVPHFLQPQSVLPHTTVVIVLDCKAPWTFLKELHTWHIWIEGGVEDDGARKFEFTREEYRECCVSISFSVQAAALQRRASSPLTLH